MQRVSRTVICEIESGRRVPQTRAYEKLQILAARLMPIEAGP